MYDFRCAQPDDSAAVCSFFKRFEGRSGSEFIDIYGEDLYKRFLVYQPGTVFMLENKKNQIVACAHGLTCLDQAGKNTGVFFLWQIAVHPDEQKKGLGKRMMREIEGHLKKYDFKRIEITIHPENGPSQKMYEKSGYVDISQSKGETIDIDGRKVVKDFYRRGAHYLVYEKIL